MFRKTTVLWATAFAVLVMASVADAVITFVVDAPNDMNSTERNVRPGTSPYNDAAVSQTYDLSTDGDSAAGLTGSLTVTGTGWFEEQHLAPVGVLGAPPVTGSKPWRNHNVFHGDYAGDLNGETHVATWTVSGYAPGANVEVYLHYPIQGNYADEAPFTITGGVEGLINFRTAPTGLVLNDTVKDHSFELLGTGVADEQGQVVLTVDGSDTWAPTDAAAFVGGSLLPDQAGDFNGDGAVEAADLALLLGNWGGSIQPAEWTTNWDSFVDANELADLLGNWGAGLDSVPVLDAAALSAIPEPATMALLALSGLAALRRRRS